MKIAVFGARGDVGSRAVKEAIDRGHDVTGIVRTADQSADLPVGTTAVVADVLLPDVLAEVLADHDVAISAVRPPDGQEDSLVPLTRSVLDAAARASTRVLIVGGAASLKMPDGSGTTVLTAPGFLPESVVPIARACQAQYEMCLSEQHADWVYLCPPAMLTPGLRTGRYRLGTDALLIGPDGASAISMEDFAVALLDEAESPQHIRTRFTVAA